MIRLAWLLYFLFISNLCLIRIESRKREKNQAGQRKSSNFRCDPLDARKCYEYFLINCFFIPFFLFLSSAFQFLLCCCVASRKFDERIHVNVRLFWCVCCVSIGETSEMISTGSFSTKYGNDNNKHMTWLVCCIHMAGHPHRKMLISWEKPNHANHRKKIEMALISKPPFVWVCSFRSLSLSPYFYFAMIFFGLWLFLSMLLLCSFEITIICKLRCVVLWAHCKTITFAR